MTDKKEQLKKSLEDDIFGTGITESPISETKEEQEANESFDSEKKRLVTIQSKMKDVPEYARIFDGSLEEQKMLTKNSTWLYNVNNQRLDTLKGILKGISKTEALNYIVNDYFVRFGNDIKKEVAKKNKGVF